MGRVVAHRLKPRAARRCPGAGWCQTDAGVKAVPRGRLRRGLARPAPAWLVDRHLAAAPLLEALRADPGRKEGAASRRPRGLLLRKRVASG